MNGIINVKKERGYTSFDVVARLRGILKMKKIGHTGTLDPDATGVLPVCLGKATRVCDLLTDKDKVYETVMLLGKTTDTQDITGRVLSEHEVNVTVEELRSVIASFAGAYDQLPPMYSALKVNGQKLCDLARRGIEVERKKRTVTIYEIEILAIALPRVTMRVHCSKGTYIRTLCEDIGNRLGCGACMEQLVRTRVADFFIENAHTLAELEQAATDGSIAKYILPVDKVFLQKQSVSVAPGYQKLLHNGNKLSMEMLLDPESLQPQEQLRVYDSNGIFVGIYEYQEETALLKPVKIFL
ncbi:MAG: tRNA pseudouridine(55) synthase TruB [Lachnospiraceae bacterium]|nr:tRNA pseudouridine(55) synthase TruB [Lachnospiraceae bacterium]